MLFDDAMVLTCYAYNLVHGNDLVWNASECMKGFTNLLCAFSMTILQLLPIPLDEMSLPVQTSGAIFTATNLYFEDSTKILWDKVVI